MRVFKDNAGKSYKITNSQAEELINNIKTAIEIDQKETDEIIKREIADALYIGKEEYKIRVI